MNKMISELMIMETEKEQVNITLREQIKSIRNTLDNLERKLDSNESLSEFDGLQGNGNNIDVYVTKSVIYDKAISRFKAYIEKFQ